MARNEKDGNLPSYEDSVNDDSQPTSRTRSTQIQHVQTSSRGQSILDNLTLVRNHHIRAVVDDSIIPIVEQQAMYGIAKSTIAMVPSDVYIAASEEEKSEFSFSTADDKQVEVIGFSSDEVPQLVRLEGQLNKTEFWRSQVHDLERVLRESLNASPHARPPVPEQPASQATALQQPRKGFFGRFNPERRSSGENPEAGARQIDAAGRMLVKVRLEEICLRTINGFGLYETSTRQCVIIRVDARC